ncbi:HNH endonuclease [Tateyamaria sp. SN6-1]|uniref:HNH endonuclease n=1 Tax=Tateyamaria sp. SN6-1 TaxID=3092148 RepID=UPI0039F48FEE
MHGHVDHIIPRSECEILGVHVYDVTNLQYLCPSCHSVKSNTERRKVGGQSAPRSPTRSNVQGREAFLAAAGIPNPQQQEETPC